MLAGKNFVADPDDQPIRRVIQPLTGMVGVRRRLFQDGIGRDHLTRHQILADAEMLQGALRLRAPELVGGDMDLAQAVGFCANVTHRRLLMCVAAAVRLRLARLAVGPVPWLPDIVTGSAGPTPPVRTDRPRHPPRPAGPPRPRRPRTRPRSWSTGGSSRPFLSVRVGDRAARAWPAAMNIASVIRRAPTASTPSPTPGKIYEVVGLVDRHALALPRHGRERAAGPDQRPPVGPGQKLLRRRLAAGGGVGQREDHRPVDMARHHPHDRLRKRPRLAGDADQHGRLGIGHRRRAGRSRRVSAASTRPPPRVSARTASAPG